MNKKITKLVTKYIIHKNYFFSFFYLESFLSVGKFYFEQKKVQKKIRKKNKKAQERNKRRS